MSNRVVTFGEVMLLLEVPRTRTPAPITDLGGLLRRRGGECGGLAGTIWL